MRFITAVLAGALCVPAFADPRTFPKRAGGPKVTFSADRVRASEATPGAAIYFAAVSLASENYTLRGETAAGWAVADANGNAEFPTAIHTRSVWLVIDAAKNGYTVAAPHGMTLQEMPFPGNSVAEDAGGNLRRVLLDRFAVDVFLVRPGTGVWSLYLRDGSGADEDQEPNGQLLANLEEMQPVGETAGSPERFRRGDYLFVVDRNSLEFHVSHRGRP